MTMNEDSHPPEQLDCLS